MNFFKIDDSLKTLADLAQQDCTERFEEIDRIAEYNGEKVLSAFIECGVSEAHLKGSTGYGYGDRGREVLDEVYAKVFGAQDALVRHNFVSGTHALTVALFGVLRPGDTLLSLTGKPYDTLEEVIGISGEGCGSLREFGVKYEQVDLLSDGAVDFASVREKAKSCKVAYIQRSRGYSLRPSLTISQIGELAKIVREVNPSAIIMVDNCYGELVERLEPTQVGADLAIGSLIKNIGGGIAQTGGYIVGKSDYVQMCAYRLTSPGAGKEVGCTLDQNRNMYLGLFMAPEVVASALKTSSFACALFSRLGFECFPKPNETLSDIIAAIKLGNEHALVAFCEGIQAGAPIDSFVRPEAWEMPGYTSKVIMAAGAFTLGASIELSADAPLREPYAVWLQGGLTYPSGRMGILLAAQKMLIKGAITINS